MKNTSIFLFLFSILLSSQEIVISGVYKYALPNNVNEILFSGESVHFSEVELSLIKIEINQTIKNSSISKEQIFIIKEGELRVILGDTIKTIGSNSVVFVVPNCSIQIENNSEKPAILYQMVYKSKAGKVNENIERNPRSFIIDYKKLKFNPHDKGGIRNYFHTNTTMLKYYEMHMTTLNEGIKSHEPHTHDAAEIVLMLDGNTQMEIGDQIYKGTIGDVYFLESNIPHAIENIGEKPCMYFAFQWD